MPSLPRPSDKEMVRFLERQGFTLVRVRIAFVSMTSSLTHRERAQRGSGLRSSHAGFWAIKVWGRSCALYCALVPTSCASSPGVAAHLGDASSACASWSSIQAGNASDEPARRVTSPLAIIGPERGDNLCRLPQSCCSV